MLTSMNSLRKHLKTRRPRSGRPEPYFHWYCLAFCGNHPDTDDDIDGACRRRQVPPFTFLKKSLTVRARPAPMPRSHNMSDFGMRNDCSKALNVQRTVRRLWWSAWLSAQRAARRAHFPMSGCSFVLRAGELSLNTSSLDGRYVGVCSCQRCAFCADRTYF